MTLAGAVAWAWPGMALWCALLAPAAVAGGGFQTPAVAPQALHALLGGADRPQVVDLRDPAEYRVGHVPGALNIPEPELDRRLGELAPEREVVLYCIAGKRTVAGEATLLGHGLSGVKHLDGGFSGWLDAELAITKGSDP